MTQHRDEMIELILEGQGVTSRILGSLGNLVQNLNERIEEHSEILASIGDMVAGSISDGQIAHILCSEIFAELAKGDRGELDRILASSVVVAEEVSASMDEPTRGLLIGAFDNIMSMSETAFARKNMRT